jgi:hypothetical protein
MIGQRRLISVISIVAGSLVCGGVAMAATGGLPNGTVHGTPGAHAADVTDSTDVGSSTSFADTSTSESTESTDTTAPGDTSTTTDTETSTTMSSPPTTAPCKPGWGYGDTNHCHSGPPGLANKPQQGGSGPSHPGNGSHGHGNNGSHGKHG